MPGEMKWFIGLAIVALIALAVWLLARGAAKRSDDADARDVSRIALTAFVLLSAACFGLVIASSWTSVPAKTIAVQTDFGKPVGELGSGLHFINPFDRVTKLDGAVQTDEHSGEGKDGTCTTVRLGNASTACVDNQIIWQINSAAATELYKNYRDTDHIRNSFVGNNLAVELNTAFSTYDPLANLANQTSAGSSKPVNLATTDETDRIAAAVTQRLQKTLGNLVTVKSVKITVVHYDRSTEDKISQYQAAAANTRIAKQNQQTAAAQAAANKILAESLNKNPYVISSRCVDIMQEMVQKGQSIPPAFSCWPGNNSNVLVGAGSNK